MPKLPVISTRDFIKFLTDNNFVYDRSSGSHHVYRHRNDKNRMVSVPKREELGRGLLIAMLTTIGFDRQDFIK